MSWWEQAQSLSSHPHRKNPIKPNQTIANQTQILWLKPNYVPYTYLLTYSTLTSIYCQYYWLYCKITYYLRWNKYILFYSIHVLCYQGCGTWATHFSRKRSHFTCQTQLRLWFFIIKNWKLARNHKVHHAGNHRVFLQVSVLYCAKLMNFKLKFFFDNASSVGWS